MPDLSHWPMIILLWVIAYFAIVAVHESGHYLAGLAIGVPRRNLRIRLLAWPQHVAFRDGDEWVSPVQIERYIKLAEPFMPTTASALIFVAGGFIVEAVALLIWAMLRLPFYREASFLALQMTLIYFIYDVIVFATTRRAGMDFSAMYSISPLFGSLIAVTVIGLQGYIVTLR